MNIAVCSSLMVGCGTVWYGKIDGIIVDVDVDVDPIRSFMSLQIIFSRMFLRSF